MSDTGKDRARPKNRDRDSDRDRGRDRVRDRSRDRDRDGSKEDRAKPYSSFSCTNSKDPALVNSRVFIGNLPTDKLDRHDLLDMFEKYGAVLGVSILSGYGFIQFAHEDDARDAVENEQGGALKGYKIDVKMAAEGKRQQKAGLTKRPPPGQRDSFDEPPFERGRRDSRDRRDSHDRRESLDRRDAFDRRDPRDRRDPLDRRDLDRRDLDRRDPLDDPYRRRLPPPPLARDFLDRRDPYVRERLPPPLSPSDYFMPPMPRPGAALPPVPDVTLFKPPYEVELILTSPALRNYADNIEGQLKPHGMVVQHNVVKSEADIPKAVEDLTRLKVPYAIIISEQNETHRSITLNILHGTPQEHRNMPLEDALKLIVRTFEAYVQEIRDKAAAPPPPPPPPAPRRDMPEFLPPDEHTSYLLNLLADNRILTLEELAHVIGYLEKRRQVLIDGQRAGPGPSTQMESTSSVFGGVAQSSSFLTPRDSPMENPANSAAINFSNPSVQKALEDLMQSGPNLLQNINMKIDQQPSFNDQAMAFPSSRSNFF